MIQFFVCPEYIRSSDTYIHIASHVQINKMQSHTTHKIEVHPPQLKPQFTNIGFGNPRYNSMVVEEGKALLPCGPSLRQVDIRNHTILMNQQIGHSQIFQIMENHHHIMVVSFEGLITFLHKNTLELHKQFYAAGKEIRHSCLTNSLLVLSAELNQGSKQSMLQMYGVDDIQQMEGTVGEVKPIYQKQGYYYYPELIGQDIYTIEYDDPNPKGKSRTETVMQQKLPIKHKALKINPKADKVEEVHNFKHEGEILCAARNSSTKQIFYLHSGKHISVLDCALDVCFELTIEASTSLHALEAYQNGVIYCSKANEMTVLSLQGEKPGFKKIQVKSQAARDLLSLKVVGTEFYLFNQYGLHLYDATTSKTYSQGCFDITNCGISLNATGSSFVVADFGGNVYTFTTDTNNITPQPITRVNIGMPVRTLVWCHDTNNIMIGCVGGCFFCWDGVSRQCQMLSQFGHTVNILRYFDGYVYLGTSDGFVHVLHSATLQQVFQFQAHFPIHYENQEHRELFGSMKNYAEIWSIIVYKGKSQGEYWVVTTCEDQTEKVFLLQFGMNDIKHELKHHLKGHILAVTSVDWKNMGHGLGPIYVTCSDDKVVRFRDPNEEFRIVHEIETSTIREWHTLTYLCLEPNGHKVAIGSQNGYLFIYDILKKQLLFGEKIHLGGVEGMDWVNGKLVTCSSDLCISIIHF